MATFTKEIPDEQVEIFMKVIIENLGGKQVEAYSDISELINMAGEAFDEYMKIAYKNKLIADKQKAYLASLEVEELQINRGG